VVPDEIKSAWDAREHGRVREGQWRQVFDSYSNDFPDQAGELIRRMSGELSPDFMVTAHIELHTVNERRETLASRKSSQNAIQALAPELPELLGGSADLTGSNLTKWDGAVSVLDGNRGNYVHYGVREFGMAAIANGISVHGGFRPFVGTFLMFSEYARNALRMAALMKLNTIFVLTHDSIGLGEDGPTHQPIEQTSTLRMIPNMDVWRPCDSVEKFIAWKVALKHNSNPTCLILSRQALPFQSRDDEQVEAVERGGYILRKELGALDVVLIATGSEVALALLALERLKVDGINARLVSLPSCFVFDQQDREYVLEVLPHGVPRVAVEAGVTCYWRKYVGLHGAVIGIDSFGESGSPADLYEHFGVTAERVVTAAKDVLRKRVLT